MDDARAPVAEAPLPSARTVRARTNLAVQAWRFTAINLRMLKMVRKGHR